MKAMNIELRGRTREHVRIYFERTRDEEIQKMCPQRAQSVEDALDDYEMSLEPDAASFGRTVYADGRYIGDVWCFALNEEDVPDAMLSFCLFDKSVWGRGAATEAVGQFLRVLAERFLVKTVGAFVYMENRGSVRVLEKNGFELKESFFENGAESGYYQLDMEESK